MKIGIITQPLHINYGGLLQNFALQRFLTDNGHEVITLDWDRNRSSYARQIISQLKHVIRAVVTMSGISVKSYTPNAKEYQKISFNTNRFIQQYIKRIDHISTSSEFLKYTKEYSLEAIIVGSDQVWRPLYCHGFLYDMFLGFAQDLKLKRIGYSVSFGTDKWEFTDSETRICKSLVSKFDAVSVREFSAIDLCREHFSINPILTLDPTMLIDISVYNKLINRDKKDKDSRLFYYILDPTTSKRNFIKKMADHLKMNHFTIMPIHQVERLRKMDTIFSIDKCVYPPVQDWLCAFRDAKFIVCDSFHGCVFSILYNKDFYYISNTGRGNARLESLLSIFGLQDRIIDNINAFEFTAISPIEWSKINDKLNEMRLLSQNYLKKALTDDKSISNNPSL